VIALFPPTALHGTVAETTTLFHANVRCPLTTVVFPLNFVDLDVRIRFGILATIDEANAGSGVARQAWIAVTHRVSVRTYSQPHSPVMTGPHAFPVSVQLVGLRMQASSQIRRCVLCNSPLAVVASLRVCAVVCPMHVHCLVLMTDCHRPAGNTKIFPWNTGSARRPVKTLKAITWPDWMNCATRGNDWFC
jgi:hypothetical protein